MTKQTRLPEDTKSGDGEERATPDVSPSLGLTARILELLEVSRGEAFSPFMISKYLRAKPNSVRRILCRLYRRGTLKRNASGHYQFKADLDRVQDQEEPLAGVHGLKIELIIPDCPFVQGGLISGTTCEKTRHKGQNWRWKYSMPFEKAWVTMTHHRGGLVEIWTKATFSMEEFFYFLFWLEGLFQGAGYPLWQYKPRLKQIGLQRDYKTIRLEGISKVTVQYARDLFISMYKKKTGQTRIEAHCWEEMGLLEAVRILGELRDPGPKKAIKEFDGMGYL